MGDVPFPQEIVDKILEFVDGETLLNCREVSPKFEAGVRYLGEVKNIWQRHLFEKYGRNMPYELLYKLYPHYESFDHKKKWEQIYDSSCLGRFLNKSNVLYTKEYNVCKKYATILDMETHGELLLIFVKYNKNYSVYNRIITINVDPGVLEKSQKFHANCIYIIPVQNLTVIKKEAMLLPCTSCKVMAVPVNSEQEYPKYSQKRRLLLVNLPSGNVLWVETFGKHMSNANASYDKGRWHSEAYPFSVKVCHEFLTMFLFSAEKQTELLMHKEIKANVTALKLYANMLILGTETGVLYAYKIQNDFVLSGLDFKNYKLRYYVSSSPILSLNVMELKNKFVIISCTDKTVFCIHIKKNWNAMV